MADTTTCWQPSLYTDVCHVRTFVMSEHFDEWQITSLETL